MFSFYSEWTDAFTNDFRDEVMMMHFKDITSYCASLSTVKPGGCIEHGKARGALSTVKPGVH
jgi:hypothetical protein